MPKALFFNVPAHGHVNPSLPLVAELVRRGHHITYFLTPQYRAKIEATGAVFQPYTTVRDDYFEVRGLTGTRPQKAAYELITTTAEILPELMEIVRDAQPDYIMFDGMCPWGRLVARISGIPAVSSLSLMAPPSPRAMLNWQALRAALPMLARDFGAGLAANKRSRALGKKYNIPAPGAMSILNSLGDISISYTSAYFQPYAETVSPTVHFVGQVMSETVSNEALPFEHEAGRQLVYVSLGTLVNDNAAFFQTCITAFADSEYFVVMSTGNRISPDAFGALPTNIAVYGWVPQTALLKRSALFITHGGLGSIHDGLYYGVPLLLVPQQEEQIFNALRVVELGAGLMLKQPQVQVETIRAGAMRLLTEPSFKDAAKHIGDTFRAAGGVTRAADEIEAWLQTQGKSR